MTDYTSEHWLRVYSVESTSFDKLEPSSILQFVYNGKKRMVFLLNPKWRGKLHALTMEPLSPLLLTRISQVYIQTLGKGSSMEPKAFYSTYIEPQQAIKEVDCYRTFDLNKIAGMPQLLVYDYGKQSRLEHYANHRTYTLEDAMKEAQSEYFNNSYTRMQFPMAFKTPDELASKIITSTLDYLPREELLRLDNCNVRDILLSSSPREVAVRYSEEYGRDWKRIVDGLLAGDSILPAIVLSSKRGYYLLAGNTRMMVGAAWGYIMPAKVVVV